MVGGGGSGGQPTESAGGRRAPGFTGHLIDSPIFLFSSMRSGSTLLRVILDSHSDITAPHELHLAGIRVRIPNAGAKLSTKELGWNRRDLEHMLWDRILATVLEASGKSHLVSKTPGDTYAWRRISAYWPEARFLFLLRHPASIAQSWQKASPDMDTDLAIEQIHKYMKAVEAARTSLAGHTVRYEDLTSSPETTVRGICSYLKVPFDPSMLAYGDKDHGEYKTTLGDWGPRIASGTIQKARPLPADESIPEPLREIATAWGYLKVSA